MEIKREFKIGDKVILKEFDIDSVKLPQIISLDDISAYDSYDFRTNFIINSKSEEVNLGVKKEWIVTLSPVMAELFDLQIEEQCN